MWFKQAANSVWNKAKNIVADQRSPGKKLMDQIFQSQEEIIPTTKLTELSNLTFDLDAFQQILDISIERIRVFKYDLDEARKNLNMLIVINYLIKHGASAFVDELRQYIPTFKKYQTLQELKTYQDQQRQSKLNYELQKIKSRAQHIQTLLEDKKKLLKEKQLSMLIKQKLKLYEKQKMDSFSSQTSSATNQQERERQRNQHNEAMEQEMSKMEWYMQKYLWKYVDKIDGKLEQVTDKIITQVDKYVVGQMPENFELDDDNQGNLEDKDSPEKMRTNYQLIGDNNNDGDEDLMRRLEEECEGVQGQVVHDSNLLEFEEVEDSPKKEEQKQGNVVENEELI